MMGPCDLGYDCLSRVPAAVGPAHGKDKHYVRRERRYGFFSRSMPLPKGVHPKKIDAKTHNGVVEVTIPIPKEAKKEKIAITPTSS